MEIYNVKIEWKDTIKRKFTNPFGDKSKGLFIKYFDVILKKIYSSNIHDIYDCTLKRNNKLIYHFKLDIGFTIADRIIVSVDEFKSFQDFHRFIKFIIYDVFDEPGGMTRVIYKISDIDYSCKIIESLPNKMRCYLQGTTIAKVELSSKYNRDVKIYDMVKGEDVEQPYTYHLDAFGQLKYYGDSEKGAELLEEKRSEVLNVIHICQTFIQFDPLDYDIV